MNRFKYLDYARAMGIIAVVWVHVAVRIGQDIEYLLKPITSLLMSCTYLPILFMISGVLAFNKIKSLSTFKECILYFFNSILRTFYILSIIFFIVNIVASFYFDNIQTYREMSIALLTFKIDDSLPSGVLWFLFSLFVICFSVAYFEKLTSINFVYVFLASILAKITLFPIFSDLTYFSINGVLANFCYFAAGYYFSDFILSLKTNIKFLLITLAIFVGTRFFYLPWEIADRLIMLISSFSGCAFILSFFACLESLNLFILKVLEYIGSNSLSIFVFHMPAFKFIKPIISKFNLLDTAFGFSLWLTLGIFIPIIIYEAISFFPKIYSYIFSRKPGIRMLARFKFVGC